MTRSLPCHSVTLDCHRHVPVRFGPRRRKDKVALDLQSSALMKRMMLHRVLGDTPLVDHTLSLTRTGIEVHDLHTEASAQQKFHNRWSSSFSLSLFALYLTLYEKKRTTVFRKWWDHADTTPSRWTSWQIISVKNRDIFFSLFSMGTRVRWSFSSVKS